MSTHRCQAHNVSHAVHKGLDLDVDALVPLLFDRVEVFI